MRRVRGLSGIATLAAALILVVGLVGCSDDGPTQPAGDPPGFVNADGINGGRLYDKFWDPVTGFQDDGNLATYNTYKDFFRCKQCHGWDRLGRQGAYINRAPSTSRPNVAAVDLRQLAETMSAQQLFDGIKSGSNRRSVTADLSTYDPNTNATTGDQMPNYAEILTDAQIWDLVRFLKVDAIDTRQLYDSSITGTYPTGSITFSNIGKDGNAARGDMIFATKCAGCHGFDGDGFRVDGASHTVGSHVRQKANESHHKIMFGQLGSPMMDLGLGLAEIKDLYKALANATKYPSPGSENPPELAAADGIRGGRLFDKFWVADAGWNQADPNLQIYNANKDFFRCKQCHGWDRLGRQGAYISRAPTTTRPNVAPVDLRQFVDLSTPQVVFDAIKRQAGRRLVTADLSTYDPNTNPTVGDQMPDYSGIMSDVDVWDLVRFLKYEAIPTELLYDSSTTGTYPNGSITFSNIGKDGDAVDGNLVYQQTCAGCHGGAGTAFPVDGGYSVGQHLRAKPNEDHHKFKFGQLGTSMLDLNLSLDDIKNLYKALTDPSLYPDPPAVKSR